MQVIFCICSCLFLCAPVFHCASTYLLQSNYTCCDLHLLLPVSAINLSKYGCMCNFKKIPFIKNFQRDWERGTHKFLRQTIYDTKYIYCFLFIKRLETMTNVTQIFHNYIMTTKKYSLCVVSCWLWVKHGTDWLFQVTEPWSKTVTMQLMLCINHRTLGEETEYVWNLCGNRWRSKETDV